jgi:hypothetical protein
VIGKTIGRFYHVQFFGDNGSHSWIAVNLLFPFQGGVEELMKEPNFIKHVSIYLKDKLFLTYQCVYKSIIIFKFIPRAKFTNHSNKSLKAGDRIGYWLLMKLKEASRKPSIHLTMFKSTMFESW